MAVLPHWDELPVNLQYSRLVLDGAEYGPVGTAQLNGTAAVLIGRAELSGTDPYTNEVHNTQADVFTLQEVSDGCVAAVRFDGDDDFYIYVNSAYRPQTLGQFIDDLGLRSHLQFSSAWYYYEKKNGTNALVEFTNLEAAAVWEMLLGDISAAAVDDFDAHEVHHIMDIGVDIPLLGYKNISMSVTDDGYLITNILQTGKAFYLGPEKTQAFVDYVTEYCTGYEIVYTGGTEPQKEYDTQSSSAISHCIS